MGLLLVLAGVLLLFADRLQFRWLGRLPGDIAITGKNGGGFYFPIVTCLLLSLLLSLVMWVINRFRGGGG